MSDIQLENLLKEIKDSVRNKIDFKKDITDNEIKDIITDTVFEKSNSVYINLTQKKEIIDTVFNSIRRLDILQPLIEDKSITEIMINGADNIFIERNGKLEKLDIRFESTYVLESVIQNIVSKVNRAVNEASPIVDARLADGSRVNVVFPPIALNGPIMTIRKFPETPMTIKKLIELGALTEEASNILSDMVKAKYNIFVSGSTGSGKTTLLNALSNFIPSDERIITIEDSAELQIVGIQNIVRLETRNKNTEGKGEITIRNLIRSSLRMRPERIIVGEVRGAEALDMLQAMNTGHDGSICTGHANSPKDMLSRLETMVLEGAILPIEAIRQQIASAIDIIVHLSRLRDKSRKVVEISEVAGYKNDEILLNPLFMFEEDVGADSISTQVIGNLKKTSNKMIHIEKFKLAGIKYE